MRKHKLPALLAAAAIVAGLGSAALPAAAAENGKGKVSNQAYIVQMADQPVTAYAGNVAGYRATKPNRNQKIDPDAPAVVSYKAYLTARHDAAMAAVGASRKLYSYGYVFSGFAADMTEAQAQKIAQLPGVLAVSKDEARQIETVTTPAFLGLSDPATGVWAKYAKGENVIIGIVDSGVWPEHPSFSDRTGANGNYSNTGKLGYQQIPGWHGSANLH
jgi:subtilisin family serine protease